MENLLPQKDKTPGKAFYQNPDGSLMPVEGLKITDEGKIKHKLSEEQVKTINEQREDLRY